MFVKHGKKLSLSLLTLAVTATTFADSVETQNTSALSHNGFYVGLGAGIMAAKNKWDYDQSYTPDYSNLYNLSSTKNLTADAGGIGPNGTAIFGYAWHLPHNMFLGTEIFGNINHVEMSTNTADSSDGSTAFRQIGVTDQNSDSEVKFTMKSNYGARVLPGYQINENLVVYGIGGWVSARGTSKAYDSSSSCVGNICSSTDTSTESNQSFYGYQLGIGSMAGISEHLFLRTDLIYSDYNEKTLQSYSDDNTQYTAKSTLSSLEANVSLVYMFS